MITRTLEKLSRVSLEGLNEINTKSHIQRMVLHYDKNYDFFMELFIWMHQDALTTFYLSEEEKIWIKSTIRKGNISDTFEWYINTLLANGLFDAYSALRLHQYFWIPKSKCKKLLLQNMNGGTAQDTLSETICRWLILQKELDEILQELHTLSHQTTQACPFLHSKQKGEWINGVWEYLETNFIPTFQELSPHIHPSDVEWKFYLS